MKSKFFYIFGGVLIVALGIYFFSNYSKTNTATFTKDQQDTNSTSASAAASPADQAIPQASNSDNPKPTTPSPSPDAHFSNESDIEGSDVQVEEVDYDGSHFSPQTLNIKLGDIVFFKNNSAKPFRPVSSYPFDSKDNIAPGDFFQFKFIKTGTYTYTDKLNPNATGKINIAK